MDKCHESKRDFLKTVAYVAPVIATFSVAPALAGFGSARSKGNNGVGNGYDGQPPGNPPQNDTCATAAPGRPCRKP